jgi:hypothetical protein
MANVRLQLLSDGAATTWFEAETMHVHYRKVRQPLRERLPRAIRIFRAYMAKGSGLRRSLRAAWSLTEKRRPIFTFEGCSK